MEDEYLTTPEPDRFPWILSFILLAFSSGISTTLPQWHFAAHKTSDGGLGAFVASVFVFPVWCVGCVLLWKARKQTYCWILIILALAYPCILAGEVLGIWKALAHPVQ